MPDIQSLCEAPKLKEMKQFEGGRAKDEVPQDSQMAKGTPPGYSDYKK